MGYLKLGTSVVVLAVSVLFCIKTYFALDALAKLKTYPPASCSCGLLAGSSSEERE